MTLCYNVLDVNCFIFSLCLLETFFFLPDKYLISKIRAGTHVDLRIKWSLNLYCLNEKRNDRPISFVTYSNIKFDENQ
jgi:hypothetical protein